jgi:glucose dehydrogenase
MKRFTTLAATLTAAVAAAVALSTGAAAQQDAPDRPFTPVTDAMLQDPPAEDWLMWRGTLNNWGFSELDQVNRDSVGGLTLVWGREMAPGLQEGTPLVHDGILYMPATPSRCAFRSGRDAAQRQGPSSLTRWRSRTSIRCSTGCFSNDS